MSEVTIIGRTTRRLYLNMFSFALHTVLILPVVLRIHRWNAVLMTISIPIHSLLLAVTISDRNRLYITVFGLASHVYFMGICMTIQKGS